MISRERELEITLKGVADTVKKDKELSYFVLLKENINNYTLDEYKVYAETLNEALSQEVMLERINEHYLKTINKIINELEVEGNYEEREDYQTLKALKHMILSSVVYDKANNSEEYFNISCTCYAIALMWEDIIDYLEGVELIEEKEVKFE